MKYYIVALFDKDSYEVLTPLQKKFTKKFRANRHCPTPHIALDVLETPSIEKITPVVEKVLKPYKQFKIEYSDNISINESLKTLNLRVENRGYIKKIHRSLTDNFELSGLNVKFYPKEDLGLSIATINHINKDKRNETETFTKEKEILNTLKVDRLEIWKIAANKKEVCLKSFP